MSESNVAETIADETVRDDPELFRETVAARPKAWGTLAARGVVRYRRRMGRAPDEATRRAIWAALWRRVEAGRSS